MFSPRRPNQTHTARVVWSTPTQALHESLSICARVSRCALSSLEDDTHKTSPPQQRPLRTYQHSSVNRSTRSTRPMSVTRSVRRHRSKRGLVGTHYVCLGCLLAQMTRGDLAESLHSAVAVILRGESLFCPYMRLNAGITHEIRKVCTEIEGISHNLAQRQWYAPNAEPE